jgi:hypothetical protein
MPKVGVDEWVAREEERHERRSGWQGRALAAWEGVPPVGRLIVFAALVASVPFITDSDFIIRVGVNTLLLGMLALGLNIVVGWARPSRSTSRGAPTASPGWTRSSCWASSCSPPPTTST